MQPWMDYIISRSQTAFIPGRDISENIILLRKIIHSFQSHNGCSHGFVLKEDLAKAFDRVNWNYLFALLPDYGFPPRFCAWVKECVQSSKFIIQFNGKGDGFIKPRRGLRQGCAMSPYLFIIAMDPLSRMLDYNRRMGTIRGLKLNRSAVPLTNAMFADDLLIMGSLSNQEVEAVLETLADFCEMSGMAINAQKSKAWFSKNSPD